MIPRNTHITNLRPLDPTPGQKISDWICAVFPGIAYDDFGFVGDQILASRLVQHCPKAAWHLNIPIVVREFLESVFGSFGLDNACY